MATTTPRIGLTKPDGTDLVDIAVLNTNFDKIDSNIASTKIQSTKPTTANAGDLWWDSDTGTLYLYYTDANSSQWVAATSDPINIGVVANQTERDAQYPTPAQGMSVYRLDLGARETYYGLYNASTNPGGRSAVGWYQEPVGRVLQVVQGTTNTTVSTTSASYVATGLSVTITPTSATSKILVMTDQQQYYIKSANFSNILVGLFRDSTEITQAFSSLYMPGASTVESRSRVAFNKLDSPYTTSAITYSTKVLTSSSTVQMQSESANSFITVMEISY